MLHENVKFYFKLIYPIEAHTSPIGGGTGGPHGPGPTHFYFWGAWPPRFSISNFV